MVLANLNRHIVLAVRDRLPIILEERGETTFSLQMVRLNQALTGRQGDKLAAIGFLPPYFVQLRTARQLISLTTS